MTFMEWTIANWSRLGHVVREERLRRELTQSALAEQAGVSRGWLIRFEHGLDNAEPSSVFRILRTLDLDVIVRPHQRTSDEDLLDEVLDG